MAEESNVDQDDFPLDGSLALAPQPFERELERSEERFRLLVSSVKDYAIFLLDQTGHIASWNAGAERIKGYRADEIIGKHFSIFYIPEDIESKKPERELKIAIETGKYEEEGWRVRQDGSLFWANVVITALFSAEGRHEGFAKVTRDMTQRRLMETNLLELNRELQSFAYSVSHDLRTPLRTIISTSRMLLEDLGPTLNSDSRDLLETQMAACKKLARTIDEILTLTRISRQEMRRQSIDISALAQEVVDSLLTGREEAAPEITVDKGMKAEADETLIRMVYLNLIENAMKFSPNGGHIHVGQRMEAESVVFFVSDEGVGFDMEYAKKIFLPFERLVTDQQFTGSGIGLANVSKAIQRLGGKVWVDSAEGKGSTFFFTL